MYIARFIELTDVQGYEKNKY